MKREVSITWKENMAFEAEMNGHKIMIDVDPENGGNNLGPRPKPFMLTALAGCTGMDVVAILKKMRVSFDQFKVEVIGDLTEEHPKHFYKMHTIYHFIGKDLPVEKLEKAIRLSEEQYCGVNAVYKKVMEMSWEIKLHNPQ